jgi:cardiolipin synthase
MEAMFLRDLDNATEVVLQRNRVRAPGAPPGRRRPATSGSSSGGRMVAGAVRVGNTVAAAITNTRVLESVEANIALVAGAMLAALAMVSFKYPRALAYPVGVFAAWLAAAVLYRGLELYRNKRNANDVTADRKHSTRRTSVSNARHDPPTQRQ